MYPLKANDIIGVVGFIFIELKEQMMKAVVLQ